MNKFKKIIIIYGPKPSSVAKAMVDMYAVINAMAHKWRRFIPLLTIFCLITNNNFAMQGGNVQQQVIVNVGGGNGSSLLGKIVKAPFKALWWTGKKSTSIALNSAKNSLIHGLKMVKEGTAAAKDAIFPILALITFLYGLDTALMLATEVGLPESIVGYEFGTFYAYLTPILAGGIQSIISFIKTVFTDFPSLWNSIKCTKVVDIASSICGSISGIYSGIYNYASNTYNIYKLGQTTQQAAQIAQAAQAAEKVVCEASWYGWAFGC